MAKNTREKAEAREEKRDTRPRAVARYVRVSPYKVRTVVDLIRGKSVEEAEGILTYCNKMCAADVKKVLLSAAANAENNLGMDRADLIVAETYVDAGPQMKRIRPVSKGRAHAILKRSCHITVILDVAKRA
ncbi:MAG: 50S ribosomal protein L22 [Clostridia bacterium]|nr:50S ribosomal protein L22 [Clostridia bacterium]